MGHQENRDPESEWEAKKEGGPESRGSEWEAQRVEAERMETKRVEVLSGRLREWEAESVEAERVWSKSVGCSVSRRPIDWRLRDLEANSGKLREGRPRDWRPIVGDPERGTPRA